MFTLQGVWHCWCWCGRWLTVFFAAGPRAGLKRCLGLLPAPCLGLNPEPWVQGQGVAEGMGAHWQCMLFACKSREVQLAVVLALVDPPVDLCWMCGVLCCLHMHMRTCMMPHLPLTHYILRGSRHSDHIGHWHWQCSCHTIDIVWVLRLQLLPGCAHAKTKAPANSWDTLHKRESVGRLEQLLHKQPPLAGRQPSPLQWLLGIGRHLTWYGLRAGVCVCSLPPRWEVLCCRNLHGLSAVVLGMYRWVGALGMS